MTKAGIKIKQLNILYMKKKDLKTVVQYLHFMRNNVYSIWKKSGKHSVFFRPKKVTQNTEFGCKVCCL